jgi:hypothetical protein
MRLASRLCCSLGVLFAGASTSTAQIVGANADSIPNASWVGIYFESFDEAAKAAELTPLRKATRPANEREVRLWTQVEMGVPKQLYRFTERDGRVRGELVLYWSRAPGNLATDERPGETMHDLMMYNLPGRCGHFTMTTDAAACRARFRREPAWKDALRETESHGLWTLPDPSLLPKENVISLDGWTMVVELRDGSRYRTYQYHDPGTHPQWPSDSRAAKIAGVLRGVDALVRPPDVHRVFRGLTTGRYRSAFRSCDGAETWDFFADLPSLLSRAEPRIRDSAPASAADTTARDSTLYEVEVLGQLTPEWLARRWNSPYPRALQVVELRAVRPTSGSRCSTR